MHILKESGNHLKRQTQIALIMIILCIASLAILLLISIPRMPFYFNAGAYEGSRALAIVFPMGGVFYFLRMYRSSWLGLEGEKQVTRLLESSLDNSYYLVNDVVYSNDKGKKRNIDHILLGPNAIFAIETKNWRGKFFYSPNYQANSNARWVQQKITDSKVLGDRKIWVQGVVVFLNYAQTSNLSDATVEVLELSDLIDFILNYRRHSFSPQELETVGRILDQAGIA
jgi:hypothetical protein